MAICPKNFRPCIDDLCYAGDCLALPGVPPLTHCGGCGELVGLDGSDPLDSCECPLGDGDDYEIEEPEINKQN